MASGSGKYIFYNHDMENPQNGWCPKDPTSVTTYDAGVSALGKETFCQRYHLDDDGWKQCDRCGKNIHCDCIMALRSFRWNKGNSITCKECVKNENLMGSNIGVSSSFPTVNFSLVNYSSSPFGNFTGTHRDSGEQILKDTTAAFVNNDAQSQILGNAVIEGEFILNDTPAAAFVTNDAQSQILGNAVIEGEFILNDTPAAAFVTNDAQSQILGNAVIEGEFILNDTPAAAFVTNDAQSQILGNAAIEGRHRDSGDEFLKDTAAAFVNNDAQSQILGNAVIEGEGILKDTTAAFVDNDAQSQILGNAAIEGSSEQYGVPEAVLAFLFEKKLSETDCSITAGRLLVPKRHAERCLPIFPGQPRIPVIINDELGNAWNAYLRVTTHGNFTKYEIDGIRRCIREMQWKAGNLVRFYQQPDGEYFIELIRREREPKRSRRGW